jgi:hypothetical protein
VARLSVESELKVKLDNFIKDREYEYMYEYFKTSLV